MPTLVKMSDTGPAISKEAPAAETTMPTVVADAAEEMKDFAIWLRLDSKPGKSVYIPRLRPLTTYVCISSGPFPNVIYFCISHPLKIQQVLRSSAFC